MVTALPRGYCPVCGKTVALRQGGLVREHTPPPADSDAVEPGRSVCRGAALPGLSSAADVSLTRPVLDQIADASVARAVIEDVRRARAVVEDMRRG